MRTRTPLALGLLLALAGCSGSSSTGDAGTDASNGTDVPPGADAPGGTDASPRTDSSTRADSGTSPDAGTRNDAMPEGDTGATVDVPIVTDVPAAPDTCALPISPASTAGAAVVGDGTPASCTEAALDAAIAQSTAVTFNCGPDPVTIAITAEHMLPADRDTTIDGGNKVTLDAGGRSRILHYRSGDYRGRYGGPQHVVTVQHIAFTNANSTGTMIVVPDGAPAACSRGYSTDGGGGALFVESGIAHVIDATFVGNHAASPGPDVAGGAVYATGSTDVTIVSSRFVSNQASNGGAVGALNSDLALVDDTFISNAATGTGANSVDGSMCPSDINGGQVGSGGGGGAVVIDGGEGGTIPICGCVFQGNTANALGGAMFRTPDAGPQLTSIDRTTFAGNSAPNAGGGAMYMHNSMLTITNSTLTGNSAPGAGAIQADGTQFDFTNVTFQGNIATAGVGGAFSVFDSGNAGTLTNCTLADNEAHGMNYAAFGGATFGSSVTFNNTLFVNNTDNDLNSKTACGTTGDGANDVQWPQNDMDPCVAGITFADPVLGPLADHGGPTLTMAPAGPASVIQTGTNCPATDQAGHPRRSPCTLGALEVGP